LSVRCAMATVTPRMKRLTRARGKQKCILNKRWRGQSRTRRFPVEYHRRCPRWSRGSPGSAREKTNASVADVVLRPAAVRRRAARWQPSRREPGRIRNPDDGSTCPRHASCNRFAGPTNSSIPDPIPFLSDPLRTKGLRGTSWWGPLCVVAGLCFERCFQARSFPLAPVSGPGQRKTTAGRSREHSGARRGAEAMSMTRVIRKPSGFGSRSARGVIIASAEQGGATRSHAGDVATEGFSFSRNARVVSLPPRTVALCTQRGKRRAVNRQRQPLSQSTISLVFILMSVDYMENLQAHRLGRFRCGALDSPNASDAGHGVSPGRGS
jgi:hypothetical protein